MVTLSPEADTHLASLTAYYEAKDRLDAARNLLLAVEAAKQRIARAPTAGRPAPRPYPELTYLQFRWILERHYLFAYSSTIPPLITAIFHDSANIPYRV